MFHWTINVCLQPNLTINNSEIIPSIICFSQCTQRECVRTNKGEWKEEKKELEGSRGRLAESGAATSFARGRQEWGMTEKTSVEARARISGRERATKNEIGSINAAHAAVGTAPMMTEPSHDAEREHDEEAGREGSLLWGCEREIRVRARRRDNKPTPAPRGAYVVTRWRARRSLTRRRWERGGRKEGGRRESRDDTLRCWKVP